MVPQDRARHGSRDSSLARVRNNALAILNSNWNPFVYPDGDDHATLATDLPLLAPDTDPLPIWLLAPGFPANNTTRDDGLDIWSTQNVTGVAE